MPARRKREATARAVATLLGWLALSATAAGAERDSPVLVPGVVVQPEEDALYLMTPEGAVEKLALSSGATLWTSDQAAKPLGVYGDRVFAQVDQARPEDGIQVLALSTRDGVDQGRTLKTSLPAGVFATVDEGMGRSFDARIEVSGGEPFLAWKQTARYSKGVAPPLDAPLETREQAVYRMDLAARRLVAVESLPPSEPLLPAAARSWTATQQVFEPPRPAGELIAATEVQGMPTSPSARIVLKRWSAGGTPFPDLELFRGPHILQLRSVDGRHLLVAERVAPSDFEEYEWTVFSLESGAPIGQLRHHRSHGHFIVKGELIVFEEPTYGHRVGSELVEEPRRIRAAVLGSGLTVWQRSLRDPAYRGPFAP